MQLSPITPAAPAQFPSFKGEPRPGEMLTLPGLVIRDHNRNGRVDGDDTVTDAAGRLGYGRRVDLRA